MSTLVSLEARVELEEQEDVGVEGGGGPLSDAATATRPAAKIPERCWIWTVHISWNAPNTRKPSKRLWSQTQAMLKRFRLADSPRLVRPSHSLSSSAGSNL